MPTVAKPRTSGAMMAYEMAMTPKLVHLGYSLPQDGVLSAIHLLYFFRGVPASLLRMKTPMMPPMLKR